MSKIFIFDFFKNLVSKKAEPKKEVERKEKIKRRYDKEPGEIKRSYTDELGNYARIRTAHDGIELWRFRSKDIDIKEISMPASDFKTMKRFVNYVKNEMEKV